MGSSRCGLWESRLSKGPQWLPGQDFTRPSRLPNAHPLLPINIRTSLNPQKYTTMSPWYICIWTNRMKPWVLVWGLNKLLRTYARQFEFRDWHSIGHRHAIPTLPSLTTRGRGYSLKKETSWMRVKTFARRILWAPLRWIGRSFPLIHTS